MNIITIILIIFSDAAIMILYEFSCGLYFRIRNIEVPWVYRNFKDHKYRSISAFSKTYFIAWLILAVIKLVILDLLFFKEIL